MKNFQKEVADQSHEEKKKKQRETNEARIKRLCIKDHINDDAWMVAEGLRLPTRQPRDPSMWTKTLAERERIRELKHIKYHIARSCIDGRKYIPIYLKLIVQVRGLEKTTYSLKCWQADIPSVLSRFKERGGEIIKYQWNGKTYAPNEVPFWP